MLVHMLLYQGSSNVEAVIIVTTSCRSLATTEPSRYYLQVAYSSITTDCHISINSGNMMSDMPEIMFSQTL